MSVLPGAGVIGVGDRALVEPDVLIVGAGPAGLTCAAGLAPAVAGEVLVLDRERQPGGVPRYCDHLGYGMSRVVCGARVGCGPGRVGCGIGGVIRG